MTTTTRQRAAALAALVAACTAHAASQWQGDMPAGEAQPFEQASRASRFIVLDTGGSGGMFNQGDIRQHLMDVAFWNDGRRGMTCGRGGAFYTRDGGLTWDRIRNHARDDYPDDPGITYYDIELVSPDEIWLAEGKHGEFGGFLWHSTDAGKTWEDVATRFPNPFAYVSDLLVSGKNLCLLAGDHWNFSFLSDDGGMNWRKLGTLPEMASHNVLALAKSDSQTLYVMGWIKEPEKMMLAVSHAWGPPWESIDLPGEFSDTQRPWALAMDFVTPEIGMITRDHGVVFRTEDGGMNWDARPLPAEAADSMPTDLWINPENPLHVLVSVIKDQPQGVTSFHPTLFESFDGGVTWQTALEGTMLVRAIFGLDANRIWVVGDQPGNPGSDLVGILNPTPRGN
jgi:photosystem II stability/assembly factor-like uncharacterized protein